MRMVGRVGRVVVVVVVVAVGRWWRWLRIILVPRVGCWRWLMLWSAPREEGVGGNVMGRLRRHSCPYDDGKTVVGGQRSGQPGNVRR